MSLIDKIRNFLSGNKKSTPSETRQTQSVAESNHIGSSENVSQSHAADDLKVTTNETECSAQTSAETSTETAQSTPSDSLDLELMELTSRIEFEVEMMTYNPDEKPIRLVGSPKLPLLDFLKNSNIQLDEKSVVRCYVVSDNWAGKSYHQVENISEYSLFEDIIEKNEKDEWNLKGMGQNTVIHITYTKGEEIGYLCLHISVDCHMGNDATFLTRVSVIQLVPGEKQVDFTKILLTFDATDPEEFIKKFEKLREDGIQKFQSGQELSDLEISAVDLPVPPIAQCTTADSRMQEDRWGDAISNLLPAFLFMKDGAVKDRLNDQGFGVFQQICYLLGVCFYKKGLYTKAYYYLSFIIRNKKDSLADKLYKDCQQKMIHPDTTQTHTAIVGGIYPLGQVLESYFDIIPTELSNLLWIDNDTNESGTLAKQMDIWKYDFKKAMSQHLSLSLYLSYRASRAVLDEEFVDLSSIRKQVAESNSENVTEEYLRGTTRACIDRSICQVDNELVIHLTREQSVITMTVLSPCFKWADNGIGRYPKVLTLQFAAQETVTHEQYQALYKLAQEKASRKESLEEDEFMSLGSQQSVHQDFLNGQAAFHNHLWGDCIYYFTKVYNQLAGQWFTSKLDEFDSAMMTTLCFELGFVYSDIRLVECAYFYLEVLAHSPYILHRVEYINLLTNSSDPRAWSVVNDEYEHMNKQSDYLNLNEEDRHSYFSFLKRRMGHIMIDQQHYEDAKKWFTALKEEPESRQYALEELRYLEMQIQNQQ